MNRQYEHNQKAPVRYPARGRLGLACHLAGRPLRFGRHRRAPGRRFGQSASYQFQRNKRELPLPSLLAASNSSITYAAGTFRKSPEVI
jgi:hypothetical protein